MGQGTLSTFTLGEEARHQGVVPPFKVSSVGWRNGVTGTQQVEGGHPFPPLSLGRHIWSAAQHGGLPSRNNMDVLKGAPSRVTKMVKEVY